MIFIISFIFIIYIFMNNTKRMWSLDQKVKIIATIALAWVAILWFNPNTIFAENATMTDVESEDLSNILTNISDFLINNLELIKNFKHY